MGISCDWDLSEGFGIFTEDSKALIFDEGWEVSKEI